ncbi:MAG: transposon-encoded TnpW family protein [Lachnospiraceae bacterium]
MFSVTCFFTIYEHSCPDCVTEVRRGNTILVVSGYFKQGTTATVANKMIKVLEAESAAGHKPPFTA